MDKEEILKTKDAYINFIAKWPDSFRHDGKTFKELFTLNGDLPLWWLTEMQKKDPEGSAVFENLCRINKGEAPKDISRGFKGTSLGYLLSRMRFLVYMILKVLIFKIFLRRKPALPEIGDCLLFASIYPDMLKRRNGRLVDRYYLDLPDNIERDMGVKTKYMSFYYSSVVQLLKDLKTIKGDGVIFYEEHLSISDILRAFNIGTVFRFMRMEKSGAFKNSFNFHGHNVAHLFKNELAGSIAGRGVFEWSLVAKAVENITKVYKPLGVVSFLEMYPYSRALYYGVRRSGITVKTVAYQHANITPMKLWYSYSPSEISLNGDYIKGMPVPDYFIFQGKMGMDILNKSGYPKERSFLTGSPRFDRLAGIKKLDIAAIIPQNKKIVLVATTYSGKDSDAIIEMAVAAAKKRADCFLLFKAHPNYPIKEALGKYALKNYVVSEDDIHQLILRSDVLLTSYSTTGDEAIALKCPVISIETGVLINMSTFFEIDAAPSVSNPGELNLALDMVFYDKARMDKYRERWPALIEASFFKLDGRSEERLLNVMKEILKR